jgi:ribosomal protein S18 acetylase RimI-like enzyme
MMASTITSTETIDLTYRPAIPSEASLVHDLITKGFRAEDTRSNWTGDSTKNLNDTFSIPLAAIENAITTENSVFMLALTTIRTYPQNAKSTQQEDVVACFNLIRKSDDTASIGWFVVAQKYQQGGVGRRVLSYAEDFAQLNWSGMRFLELNALSSRDNLIMWYERCGYVKTGKVVPFPEREAVNLPKDLGFIYLQKSLGNETRG